ncbi:MAG TPA: adenylate/guanylate cyclase domain-containing protein [Chitinophagaceae bacterium]|nr:adenylate/guanylate cyclase domain-containing protein [Chitinophagaceae bacterium]
MRILLKKPGTSYLHSALVRWCRKVWTGVTAVGITGELTLWQRKRIRLLNGICFFSILACCGYVITWSGSVRGVIFWQSLQALFMVTIPIILNYYRRYSAACHFFCIYNLICFTFFAIASGKGYGAEYFLIANSLLPMLLFKELRVMAVYFFLNLLFFGLCKYGFTVIIPFLPGPTGNSALGLSMIMVFFLLFLIVYYFKSENAHQEELLENKNRKLVSEKQKSDELLLNILPEETAGELKETGNVRAKRFEMVTVMFTDFKGFTNMTEMLSSVQLVKEIDQYYSAFDYIISQYGIEKIKTIGDAYMCAGGLPRVNSTHPQDVIGAALAIRDYIDDRRKEKSQRGEPYFELRIGIHTGPVVAGIVGIEKFAYDIWGSTVNTAASMESLGEVRKVNISGDTYVHVKDYFRCTYRGKIAVKHEGAIDMYFVEGKL